MPEAGNLDSLFQHHREHAVNHHIKISLYDGANPDADVGFQIAITRAPFFGVTRPFCGCFATSFAIAT
jgi:hypothetical protein